MDSNEAVPHASAGPAGPGRILLGLLKTMRPRQWAKNVFVFAALIFDSKLTQAGPLLATLGGFVALCLLSSSVYLLNDAVDVEKDRQHPKKRFRPVARGDVSPGLAMVTAAVIGLAALAFSFWLHPVFGLIGLIYLAINVWYSFQLKHVVIIDVLTIAAGFVLRVAAGVPLVDAERFSPWLFVCMSLLALLIGFGKRRQELVELKGRTSTRAILGEYNLPLLDQIIAMVTAAVIIAYSFYTFSAPQLPANHSMMLTIPIVLYGIFRYLYLVHVRGEGGAPEEIIFKDRPMQITGVLWGLAVILVLYVFK
ncbi:MAG: decaprenyl-phosphate phosphoribosyltransferase [Thermoflexales bacterium]|nr:decaprenyl-phosphate phosphoribosyltransferase [Thermoflexales bacterium]